MFIFDFRYDRKLGARSEVFSPNLHDYLHYLPHTETSTSQ